LAGVVQGKSGAVGAGDKAARVDFDLRQGQFVDLARGRALRRSRQNRSALVHPGTLLPVFISRREPDMRVFAAGCAKE
jgi:hypothetical protein